MGSDPNHLRYREADPMYSFRRLICFWIFLVVAGVATAGDAALDGLKFTGRAGEQGKGDHHDETIGFEGGLFRSPRCEKWGFRPAHYTVKKEGDSYHFAATLTSSDRGTLEWRGTVKGGEATATFRWIEKRWYSNIDRQYWFKGTRVSDR